MDEPTSKQKSYCRVLGLSYAGMSFDEVSDMLADYERRHPEARRRRLEITGAYDEDTSWTDVADGKFNHSASDKKTEPLTKDEIAEGMTGLGCMAIFAIAAIYAIYSIIF